MKSERFETVILKALLRNSPGGEGRWDRGKRRVF